MFLYLPQHLASEKTITIPGRGRVKVTVDDSGTVTHLESDERLDALVRPKSIRYALRKGPA